MEISPHTLSLQQTLKGVEAKLLFLGNGQHTPQQANEHQTLTALKQRLLEQIKSSIHGSGQQQSTQNTTALSSPSPLSTTPLMTTAPVTLNQTISKPPVLQPQVVLSKPRPPAPQFITQVPKENDNKILNRQRLQELIKEIDPTEQLDEEVEETNSGIFQYPVMDLKKLNHSRSQ
uniref:Uncharacterized protein n=1 Tax=Ciona savignyi TaxID=51511 RepID=H2ZAZ2_CIOSA